MGETTETSSSTASATASASAAAAAAMVTKTAKKTLKRLDSGSMKIKPLVKAVRAKIGNDAGCKDTVKRHIESSDAFDIDGKLVTLAAKSSKEKKQSKKRDRGDDDSRSASTSPVPPSTDDAEAKRAAKKARKEAKKKAKKEAKKKKNKRSSEDDSSATSGDGGASSDACNNDENNPAATVASATTTTIMDDDGVKKWREEHKIVLRATSAADDEDASKSKKQQDDEALNANAAYRPYATFECGSAELATPLLTQCTVANGFLKPSPIQAQCWPVLLHKGSDDKRRDVVGIAETGSGKTLAFALPALTALYNDDVQRGVNKENQQRRGRAPRMLTLAPTRELAMQSHKVLEEFGATVNLTSIVLYGGVPKPKQIAQLRAGVDCVLATPGRLKDLINDGACDLSQVSFLVLDEADRMLDMGFEEDVKYIISQCKPREARQTAMFSATWPAAIQQIALEYMIDPVRVYVGFEAIVGSNGENGEVDDSLSANKRVTQTVEVIDDRARDGRLRQLLQKFTKGAAKDDRVLIFALYKKEAERLERSLQRDGYRVSSIHGNKTQDARTRALAEFKDGSCPLLVATDVAARGLDIPNVAVVLNYTFPLTIEDYVHRIGRTGRAGKTGVSYTFFQPGDKSHAGELQQVMKQAGQTVPEELMKFGSTIKKKEHKLYGNFGPRSGNGGAPMKKATKIRFD